MPTEPPARRDAARRSPGRHRPQRLAGLWLAAACALGAAPARASLITACPLLSAIPAGLVDPLGTLALGNAQFLVPVQVQAAVALDSWQFSLSFDAGVAAPADAGGLFQSVYQADFGAGDISQISSSGLSLNGLLQDVSGWYAPGVSGDGVLAYVLFEFLPGHEGQDPGVAVAGTPGAQVPEPSTLALLLAACGVAAWSQVARRREPVDSPSTL